MSIFAVFVMWDMVLIENEGAAACCSPFVGEKRRRTQKSGASDLKNQAEAPLHLVQSLNFAI